MKNQVLLFAFLLLANYSIAQNYYYEKFQPFDSGIPSPSEFLGYDIGAYHTRHDLIIAYLSKLAEISDRAEIIEYGRTHELRQLVILQISDPLNLENLETHRQSHLQLTNPELFPNLDSLQSTPVFVNLGYNVHGNEPSSSEAALLTAYVMIASNHPDIEKFRKESVVFIDPAINPDGRDRHTQWANSHRSNILNSDPVDSEHNEMWPRGRTNHYWFDLNRDWLLAVHPESQGKLKWYHQWYPNVVTDFHEMGSNSSYFFEPMKTNGSKDPIMPVENYTTLNDVFAEYYSREMDKLGSLYFTKEVFDGTYPGYGSSYPDIQGGLGILFEQASSRGHIQETDLGEITFSFTIRNQFTNSIATVEAAVDNKKLLHEYQFEFFKSAIANANKSKVKAYVFGEPKDKNRLKAFIELLLRHQIRVYPLSEEVYVDGKVYSPDQAFVVPTAQPQYRMVQTVFETYNDYQDSVFYDASAWSLVNAYNISYAASGKSLPVGEIVDNSDLQSDNKPIHETHYAYITGWEDYNSPAFLYYLLDQKVRVLVAKKPFSIATHSGNHEFSYGSLIIPVQKQDLSSEELYKVIQDGANTYMVDVYSTNTGFSGKGIDLGSRYMDPVRIPKAAMIIGDGVNSYEAGFVWHLLDQRVNMPLTKIKTELLGRADLSRYNVLVLVSGNYNNLDSADIARIKTWASQGNTLITIGSATSWAIRHKLVSEALMEKEEKEESKDKKEEIVRHDYIDMEEIQGKEAVGGAIFNVDLDLTHPIGYGYSDRIIPTYRNNSVWLKPGKNEYSNIALYTDDPHVDGFITDKNLNVFLKKSAAVIASRIGSGRAILFATDPNFRGTWYGTNKMFLNALFFGNNVRIP